MKKLVSILSIIVILIALIPVSIGASFKFTPTISETNADVGDTITINLKLSDINVGEKGINTFKCTFLYDKDVFEDILITPKNNWSINYNNQEGNEQYGTLLAVLIATGVTEDQDIGTITAKIKEGTEGKVGEINFTAISTNDGKNEIPEVDKILKVTVKNNTNVEDDQNNGKQNVVDGNEQKDESNTQTGNEQEDKNNTQVVNEQSNNNAQNNQITSESKNTQEGNLISKNPLPQTGIDETIIFIGIILAFIAIVVFYIQFRRNKDIK